MDSVIPLYLMVVYGMTDSSKESYRVCTYKHTMAKKRDIGYMNTYCIGESLKISMTLDTYNDCTHVCVLKLVAVYMEIIFVKNGLVKFCKLRDGDMTIKVRQLLLYNSNM